MTTILAVIGTALAYEMYLYHRQTTVKAHKRERRRFMSDYAETVWQWQREGRRQ